ncbi:hypothetical protein KR032_008672 [Drosophila birchii]|nr:hypothetical protein KR032_008672 [Drosophila birchii]
MDAQFEHLCRICAANTKSKTNSVVESVFIFKTQGLKDKISRHLYLNVAEDDPLPKVLCKSCYRQVEATASLSNIAKHTQLVFRDFLLSTLPKNAREAAAARLIKPPAAQLTKKVEDNIAQSDEFRPIMLTHVPETTITVSKPQTGSRPQEEGGNYGTRSNKAIMRSEENFATEKSNLLPMRRSSVFVDSRHGSAPMSIAQRSMQHLPSLAPLSSEVSAIRVSKKNPEKKLSPAGVINFIQTHGRITGNVPVAGKSDNSGNTSTTTATLVAPTTNAQGTGMASNVLHQKRRNLKNSLTNKGGQMSLLKSTQIRNPVDNIRPSVTATVVPQEALYGCEPSVEEALPEHMIFAVPKKKREDEEAVVQTVPPKLKKGVPANKAKSLSVPLDLTESSTGPHASGPTRSMPIVKSLTDAISLGSVIRDPDLLMLILKALKWPVSAGNCEEQMARLKCSKFAVIMSDNNLLQDTDLTQLLGPYLGPMLAVAQQQEKQAVSSIATAGPNSSLLATKELLNLTDLSTAMPYKLPPETSVQLVPSSPTEVEPPPLRSTKSLSVSPVKRSQRKMRTRERPSGESPASTSKAAHVSSELLNINAMLISQFGSNPADALNEALISLLKQQQKSKEQRCSRRRRIPSNDGVNLEDIVLVEPQPLEPGLYDSEVDKIVENVYLTKQTEPPATTRPIVKRQRTIINASKLPETVEHCNTDSLRISKSATSGVLEEKSEKTVQEVKPSIEEPTIELSQAPTSTVPEAASHHGDPLPATQQELPEAIEASPSNGAAGDSENGKADTAPIRKSEVKAALGQKLLEAIGLPQLGKDVAPESSRDTLRSALKRSLKQAQEQQQQLKRVKQEPVKQLADSTTKLSAAESADERKKVIAERELALLKRKSTASGDDTKLSVKDEKTDRTDVSSSSSRNRRSRKSKTDTTGESGDEERKFERWDVADELPLKSDAEKAIERRTSSSSSNRPTRTSKSLSKYYKGPSPKSQHAMGTRSTRQR